ncbi:MAG: ABC transporter permease [Planctomycetota bacterium]|nr:MAG: ABC transporter permease [Planctomycetota bacterium]
MSASPVDVIETAQVPASSRGVRANKNRLGIGLWLLLAFVAMLLLSTPWSFGEVTLSGTISAPRWAAGNLQLSLMPPAWMADQADMERAQKASAANQYVPAMLLGTDRLGRDVLARLCAGSVISLSLGISAALVATAVGVLWGCVAAWFGGRVDSVLMRSVDVLYALPSMLLVTLLGVAVDGFAERALGDFAPTSRQVLNFFTMLVAISGVGWLTMSRVVRGQVLSLRERPYVEAARAAGAGTGRIFWWHLLPNLAGPVAAYAALAVPGAILSESFLSFLGIGIRDPLPSLGNLAAAGLPELNLVKGRWWLLAPPCAVVAFALLTLNFAADRLRDRLDPASAG